MSQHWKLTLVDGDGEAWTDAHGQITRIVLRTAAGRMELVPSRGRRGRSRGLDAVRSIADLQRLEVIVEPAP